LISATLNLSFVKFEHSSNQKPQLLSIMRLSFLVVVFLLQVVLPTATNGGQEVNAKDAVEKSKTVRVEINPSIAEFGHVAECTGLFESLAIQINHWVKEGTAHYLGHTTASPNLALTLIDMKETGVRHRSLREANPKSRNLLKDGCTNCKAPPCLTYCGCNFCGTQRRTMKQVSAFPTEQDKNEEVSAYVQEQARSWIQANANECMGTASELKAMVHFF
jgi:hypothetical protein